MSLIAYGLVEAFKELYRHCRCGEWFLFSHGNQRYCRLCQCNPYRKKKFAKEGRA